jgi:hypothetical protein
MQIKKGDNKMAGNKHNNGVHEVGTPETLKAYQEDTPNQSVEKYLAGIKEVIEEKKDKQKKSFMQVFQNPLKGFPYNEELDDNFVKPLEETVSEASRPNYKPVKKNHYDVVVRNIKKKDAYAIFNFTKDVSDRLDIEDIDADQITGSGMSSWSDGDMYIQGDDAGKVGLEVLKKFKSKGIKVLGESVEIEEGKYAKYSDLLMKKAKEMQAIDKAQNKSGVANPSLNALKSINKEIEKEMKKLGITESINDDLEEGKMGELFQDIQNGATAKEIARDYPVSIAQAKEFLKDYYSQKKKPMKMGEEILRNYDSLLEAKDLMPDIKKIVDTKSATKVGGIMLDMFTASMILTVYDKVNDQNKGKMEKSNIQTLVHIAHKVMGVKEETLNERSMKMKDIVRKHKRELQKVQRSGNLELSKKLEADLMQWAMDNGEVNTDDPDDFIDWLDRDLDDIMKGKIKESISESNWGFVFYNKKSLDNFLKDPYIKSVTKNVTIDQEKFRGGKSGFSVGIESDEDLGLNPLAKKVEKIKKKYGKPGVDYAHVEHDGESISEGTWALPKTSKQKKELKDLLKKPVVLGKDGDDASDKLYDLIGDDGLFDDLYKAGQKNPKGDARPIIKAKMKELGIKEGKMDGSKLTGQEISVYFRRHKVRDKQVRKAVEFALDHGGAMTYAIKGIEKMKKGLSKNKDVVKALNYANYGTEQKVPEVGFMFKENSPIAGDIKLEGDQYIPQKKGVNKNIANYWNKEIKGLKPKELEAIQSMYMITDHSGVVQMYKAGKRDFIKSIKS